MGGDGWPAAIGCSGADVAENRMRDQFLSRAFGIAPGMILHALIITWIRTGLRASFYWWGCRGVAPSETQAGDKGLWPQSERGGALRIAQLDLPLLRFLAN